ncbi:MAG: hypothetical protein MZV63_39295 [Marinilabiliales bacterium]|nr:hypothetical protein [Marinilabiliales bacterium]
MTEGTRLRKAASQPAVRLLVKSGDVRRASSAAQGSSETRPAGSDNRTTTGDAAGQIRETVRRNTSDAVKSAQAANRGTSSTGASRQATTSEVAGTAGLGSEIAVSCAEIRGITAFRLRDRSQLHRGSEPWAEKAQSTVQRSEPTVQRSQSTVQRSEPTVQRSQSTAQRSEPSAQRSQSTAQRSEPSRQMTAQKSSPSVSQRPSAPAAKAQSQQQEQQSGQQPQQLPSAEQRATAAARAQSGSDNSSHSSRR